MSNADRLIAAMFHLAAAAHPTAPHVLRQPPEDHKHWPIHGPVIRDAAEVAHDYGSITVILTVPNLMAWADRINKSRGLWDGKPLTRPKPPRWPWPREHVAPD